MCYLLTSTKKECYDNFEEYKGWWFVRPPRIGDQLIEGVRRSKIDSTIQILD